VDLDPDVGEVFRQHVQAFAPARVELVDLTSGRPTRRVVPLLFTDRHGRPISDQRWSEMWAVWRAAAAWPADAGFHVLRHFNATSLITQGVEPQAVQRHLRHASLKITLETYVGWWPRSERARGVVGGLLRSVDRLPHEVVEQARSIPLCTQDVPDDRGAAVWPAQGG
jgi:integrase